MNLLHKQFRDLVETEGSGTLQEDDLIGELMEHLAMDELLDALEEITLYSCEPLLLFVEDRADAYELRDSTRVDKFGHFGIKVFRGETTLLDVAQYECERLLCCLTGMSVRGAALHEIECNVERLQVGIITIVDECAAITTLFHLKTHSNGLQLLHALIEVVWTNAKMQGYKGTDYGILNRSIVNKRNAEPVVVALLERIGHSGHCRFFLYRLDVHGGVSVFLRPDKTLALEVSDDLCLMANQVVVGIVDNGLRIVEKLHLLCTFLLKRREVLLMG